MRVALVNPNTNRSTTDQMVAIARGHAPEGLRIEGVTAASGCPLITDEGQLARAASAVGDLTPQLAGFAGVLVAAFGDPGLDRLRKRLSVPVVGIGEASMAAAATRGRFAVATTTPLLAGAIGRMAALLGFADKFVGVLLTRGDPSSLMADGDALRRELSDAVARGASLGAEAVIIGGGPLSTVAREIAPFAPISLVEPIPEAVAALCAQITAVAPDEYAPALRHEAEDDHADITPFHAERLS